MFGFLGPNGAGKTTTIRVLLDLIRPTEGQASVLGLDCQRDSQQVRSRVGYLPGELSLWPDETGRAAIEHLARVRGPEVPRERIHRLADRLDADLEMPIEELSSGNKQKIGLVQALMSEPELAILDEPTRGLDPLVQREVLSLVAEARDDGRSVFFSSHVLHEVEQVCDRVGLVRQGRLVAVEDVDELVQASTREVDAVLTQPPPEGAFAGLENVRHLEQEGSRIRLRVDGPIDPLIKRLAEFEVVDLRSQAPSLEDLFLAHYEVPEEASHGS